MTENGLIQLKQLLKRHKAEFTKTGENELTADFPDLEWRNDFLDIFGHFSEKVSTCAEFAKVPYAVESDTRLRFDVS